MKKSSIIAVTICISAILVFAIPQKNYAQSGGYVWKVTINQSKFYLVGSVHAAKPASYPLPDIYELAYKASSKVIMELKEEFNTLNEKIFEYGEKYKLPEDKYLDKHLDEKSTEFLEKLFKGQADMLERYYKYNGWMLNMAIAGRKYTLIGYDPELALDKRFNEKTYADGKEIIGLDKLETQLQLFEFDLAFETQLQVLNNAISGAEAQAQAERPLLDSYFSYNHTLFGNTFVGLYDFDNPQVQYIYDMVFTSRNKAWVEKMKELAAGEPETYFMMVGCGHFFGLNNVRALLEAEGYKVEFVPEVGL